MMRYLTTLACLLVLTIATTTARAQTGTLDCDLVHGDLDISSITPTAISGTFSGGLEGSLATTVVNSYTILTPLGPVKYIRAHSLITTADGTLSTRDNITVFGYQGHRVWLGHHKITEGTGVYEDHVGRLKTRGEVLQGGVADLRYKGAICTVTISGP